MLLSSPMSINNKNLFLYCDDNPVNRFDIYGNFCDTVLDLVFIGVDVVSLCTDEEYEKLSDKQKKSYTYYEWDKPNDWYKTYNIITHRIECMLNFLIKWDYYAVDDADWDERHPTADYVRLIAYSN